MTVVDFQRAKEEREPHTSGEAKCLHCNYVWQAVAPLRALDGLECPECGTNRGVWNWNYGVPDDLPHYECGCGNNIFHVFREGITCLACGDSITYEELADVD